MHRFDLCIAEHALRPEAVVQQAEDSAFLDLRLALNLHTVHTRVLWCLRADLH